MFWEIITAFGDIRVWLVIALIFFTSLLIFPKKIKKYSWFIFKTVPAIIIGFIITYILKILLKIPRPCLGLISCPNSYSFPSSHATVIFAATTTIVLNQKNNYLRFALIIFAILVSLSRVILDLHTIYDLISGSIIGIVVGLLVQKIDEKMGKP